MSPALSDELLARWSEPHRRHHDAAHLREVLDATALLAEHKRDVTCGRTARDATWPTRSGG